MNIHRCNKRGEGRDQVRRFVDCVMGIVVITVLTMPRPVYAEDRSQLSDSTDQSDLTDQKVGSDTNAKHRRRIRRSSRSLGEHQGKRMPRERQARRAKRDEHKPPFDENAPIRLQLNGSFELDLGSGNVMRSEGNAAIELDRATAVRLHAESVRQMGHLATDAKNLLQVLATLPETMEKTTEILKLLSDPETQANLRQVEQLLRLLPGNSATPE